MSDDIARLSEELARDPASMAFLELAELLRKRGNLEVAAKVAMRGLERHPHLAMGHDVLARIHADAGQFEKAYDEWGMVLRFHPGHPGALKGLAFVCFHQENMVEAETWLAQAAVADPADQRNLGALAYVRQQLAGTAASLASEASAAPARPDARSLFQHILGAEQGMALLLDEHGLVLAGGHEVDGRDVGQEVGAQLGGVSEEAERAMRHLGLGKWTSIVFETAHATVAMAPAPEKTLMMVSASRATPVGFVRRMLERSLVRATQFLGGAA